jgi:transposase
MKLMPVYGPQFKEQIVKKMMPPHNQSVAQISRDTGVAVPTLYSWKKTLSQPRIRRASKALLPR